MCGRYVVASRAEEIREALLVDDDRTAEAWAPRWSIAPTEKAPIVRQHGAARVLELASWGLRPAWAKTPGPRPTNARIETITTNGMFRAAAKSARCIVPMTGYYEWTVSDVDGGKDAHYLASTSTPILAAAGLGAARHDGDEWKLTFTIITRAGVDAAGEVHDRMPAFLPAEMWDAWLDVDQAAGGLVDELHDASAAIAASVVPKAVSRRINSVRAVDPSDASLVDAASGDNSS